MKKIKTNPTPKSKCKECWYAHAQGKCPKGSNKKLKERKFYLTSMATYRTLKELDYNLTKLEEAWYKKQQYDKDEIEILKRDFEEMKEYYNMGFMAIIRRKLLRWLNVFNP